MKQFLMTYGPYLAVVLFALLYVYIVYLRYGKKKAIDAVRDIIVNIMEDFESKIGEMSGSEQNKFQVIADAVWDKLPLPARLYFLNKKALAQDIEKLYHTSEDLVDDGKINGSVKPGPKQLK